VEPASVDADGVTTEQPVALPWHLKLLAAAAAVYLGYRAWQGIAWLVEWL
jgi:hypothetical protein